jgi:3-deoxy-7-phosphoheptulonate synthase
MMMNDSTDDTRILGYDPLLPPQILMEEMPLTNQAKADIQKFRAEASKIVAGADDRLLIVVGPCSIHDPAAALEYAGRLKVLKGEIEDACLIVMRSYCNLLKTASKASGLSWEAYYSFPQVIKK